MSSLLVRRAITWVGCTCFAISWTAHGRGQEPSSHPLNLAPVATASCSFVSPHERLTAIHDGSTPRDSDDKSQGAYGNWPRNGTQWVQYDWTQPVTTTRIEVYWFDDHRGVRLPTSCRLLTWNGREFQPVPGVSGLGLEPDRFNVTTFPELTTSRLRLEFDSNGTSSTGILEWRVHDSGHSPNFPPRVNAGVDRVVVSGGSTYLDGRVIDDGKPQPSPTLSWSKASGPGNVVFQDPAASSTSATFSQEGEYELKLTADDSAASSSSTLRVTVVPSWPAYHYEAVPTTAYGLDSRFWQPRVKALITQWIPHCIRKIEDPATREGGLDNFVATAKKLAGQPHDPHKGYVFSNTWVYNTLESMCLALMVDPKGDPEIQAAQAAMRQTIEHWIPAILAAQEPDGYLHTETTLNGRPRWSDRGAHEGYQAGYFLEAAMAHYRLTRGQDRRLLEAARKLADCWCDRIGPPPRKPWFEGHQEFEQALVRFGRFIDSIDGPGAGRKYQDLGRYLLDARQGGDEYDQSHLPVTRQYSAVGHAVRALYSYLGMAEVAISTRDADYQSAVMSLWDNLVNRKLYLTGGVGSGETSEGFGADYSLPNRSYCETCAGCGELFFQSCLNRATGEARFADLSEEALYNIILGGLDLDGKNFTYTNSLDSSEARYDWHVCPCCVGNFARTLLSLPTWMYSRAEDRLLVNLFIGSTVDVGHVAGTPVKIVQSTDYPWNGEVSLRIEPAEPRAFHLAIRDPSRKTSALYEPTPDLGSIADLQINGEPATPSQADGYLVLKRLWNPGDTVTFRVPLKPQRVHASEKLPNLAGRVALRYGPLVYNIESVDQDLDKVLSPDAELLPDWDPQLLGGVQVIRSHYTDGSTLLAIPNYARLNRGGRSIVWIREH